MKSVIHPWDRRIWMILALGAMVALPFGVATVSGNESDEEPPIIKYMTVINDHYKDLRREARYVERGSKEFSDESVKAVAEMIEASAKALHEDPPMMAKIPQDKHLEFRVGYRKVMQKLIHELINLEIAMMEGRGKDAAGIVETLGIIKKEGHDSYVEE